ncbi:MAG: hypothetical protein HZC55_00585 [Verrucomicrobia bacterium]|nr:hypothetical protein [Verrucomicrobiota bacterium]
MLGALLYLRLTSARNWAKSRLRRLRQPKYLVGAIVGCAYFYFFFFRHLGRQPTRRLPDGAVLDATHAALPTEWLPVTTALGAVGFLILLALIWLVPSQRAALGFTEAEIAFLFPAPITRRALIHFRLLSSQLRSLVGAAVMMLFSNRWAVLGGNAVTHAIGWWFIFSSLNLHFSGASFTLTRLADLGWSVWRRRLLVFAAFATVVAVSIHRLPPEAAASESHAPGDLRAITAWVVTLAETAPLAWLLVPVHAVLGPFLAIDTRHFLLALGPALGVVILHYLWVVRSAVAFEDSAIAQAQQRSARLAAWREGRSRRTATTRSRRDPFALAATGRPELAFLWKNLLSTWPYFRLRVFLVAAAILTAGCVWLHRQPTAAPFLAGVGVLAVSLGAYLLILGPQFARQDIRSDLGHADVLRVYPLRGWQIILGELLTPVCILTAVVWLTLLVGALCFWPSTTSAPWLSLPVRVTASLGLALITPALVALQLLVPNAAALLFPAWFQATRSRGGGPEVVGQRMIFVFAQIVAMALALLPAAALAAVIIAVGQWLWGTAVAVGFASVGTLVLLVGEVGGGVWFLGTRFERLDLSAEPPPSA